MTDGDKSTDLKFSAALRRAAEKFLKCDDAFQAAAEELREAIQRESWQQTTIARALGITPQTLNAVVNGRRPPSRRLAEGILGRAEKRTPEPKKKSK